MLKKGGILVSIAGYPDPATFAARGVRAEVHLLRPNGGQSAEIAKLIEAGTVKPHVGVKLPPREAAKAHQRSEGGHSRGKIVVTAEQQGGGFTAARRSSSADG